LLGKEYKMDNSYFFAAYGRMQRAWLEAKHQLSQRGQRQRRQIAALGGKKGTAATSLATVFQQLEQSPCQTCGRCCTKAAMDSGYFKHDEREQLIAQGVDIFKYVVTAWPQEEQEPPWRCLFLGPTGCNIPSEHRSSNCLTYVCHDKLGPTIIEKNLEKAHKKAHRKFLQATRKKLPLVPFQRAVLGFGEQ
jgi:Fe-S-cluster containining protein